jgi:hypothetical protein
MHMAGMYFLQAMSAYEDLERIYNSRPDVINPTIQVYLRTKINHEQGELTDPHDCLHCFNDPGCNT